MNLIVTDPTSRDLIQYHEIITEPHIQDEFHNFRGQQLKDTENELEYWIKNRNEIMPYFLRLIKLTSDSNALSWDDSNSRIIGFIANTVAGPIEGASSGFHTLINFGISKQFEGKGLMTMALEMTLEKLYELNFNICPAYVKHRNLASARVLEKCGFDLIRETPMGKSYVKALNIDPILYRRTFEL